MQSVEGGGLDFGSDAVRSGECRRSIKAGRLHHNEVKSLGPAAFHGRPRQGPDPTDLGHPIPISFVLGRNEVAVVGVTAFIAYRTGFAFTLSVVFADPQNNLTPLRSMHLVKLAQMRGDDSPQPGEQFQLGLTFSDGSSVTRAGEFVLEGGPETYLTLLDGSGGGVVSTLRWYVEPLPPPGPIAFWCEWPTARLAFRHQLAIGTEIQDAAKESKDLGRKTE